MKCKICGFESTKEICSKICKNKDEILKKNAQWLKREIKEKKPMALVSKNFNGAYAYRKEPGFLKKFKAVRG